MNDYKAKIEAILDIADPNHPTGFWRKQRATASLLQLLTEARISEIDHALFQDELNHNGMEVYLKKRKAELKGEK